MTERTEYQAGGDQQRSRQLSLQGASPPAQLAGYEAQRFLGAGAYGEVWVALDRNTGRRVAIKFYMHRGGLDWSLLSREVEKLAFLSADRYVVQLLEVGWDADPPYYVMEYLERGSLEDQIAAGGPLPVAEAVAMFREIAVGLLHAHGKGVLHCDLKPANVLVDEDSRPRLADFGQSRLSHEQIPALGTLFYMAPEQADVRAMPDAQWDVYALGAVFYAMLTGSPPHRDDTLTTALADSADLNERLRRYRHAIRKAPPPRAHRQARGVDRALCEIVDRMLAVDPRERFANVQSVLDALAARDARRQRRPLVMLGTLGPALVLLITALFAWQWFATVVRQSDRALTQRAIEGNKFAAQFVARAAGGELGRRYRAVEQLAHDVDFRKLLGSLEDDSQLAPLRAKLSDPSLREKGPDALRLREQMAANPLVVRLENELVGIRAERGQPTAASWFVTDAAGLQLVRTPHSRTIGRNYAWRTYFSGQSLDKPRDWRPSPADHIVNTHLSAPFLSQATGHWVVTVSTPIYAAGPSDSAGPSGLKSNEKRFLGVVALTVEAGGFVELRGDPDRFGVLVDLREGPNQGLLLQHPIYDLFRVARKQPVPERIARVRLAEGALPLDDARQRNYVDPFAADPDGGDYNRHWLAALAPVTVRDRDTGEQRPTGWQVIVEQSYDAAIGGPLDDLRRSLVNSGLVALVLVAAVLTLLWRLVLFGIGRVAPLYAPAARLPAPASSESIATLPDIAAVRKHNSS